jgi:hypothetical protein
MIAGCAFIKYPQREMAQAAINALNGTYTMPVSFRQCSEMFSLACAFHELLLNSDFYIRNKQECPGCVSRSLNNVPLSVSIRPVRRMC